MGNTVTKSNDSHKINKLQKQKDLTNEHQITTTTGITTVGDQQNIFKNQQHQTKDRKLFDKLKQKQQPPEDIIVTKTKTSTAENTAAATRSNSTKATVAQQKHKQNSTWSLASLSTRFNWSFSGSNVAVRNSFRQRNKSTRKSSTSLQQLRRSKTTWHKPTTNAIFISHFKESSSQFNKQQFQIEQLVAKGAFGIVFKVSDKQQQQQPIQIVKQEQDKEIATASNLITTKSTPTSTSTAAEQQFKFYALKVLKKSKILAENGVQQIKDEADIQKLCGHHPFIVQQFDLWQNRHNLHILSEFVPNGELFSKIANFTLDLIRLYLAEIALAIDFLHNAGIIYRDAKPENILLTHNFHIKLTDFGLSKWLKLGMTTRTMCGTFQYMAPEILRGEAYGHAADWWSLGIIVCQMAVQKTPDFRQFLQLTFLPATPSKSSFQPTQSSSTNDHVDNAQKSVYNEISALRINHTNESSLLVEDFLPAEVETLAHETKDVLKRLLTINPKQRLRSVLALQRIALYKNFKIDANHLLSISVPDIFARDDVMLYAHGACEEAEIAIANKAFHDF